MIRKLFILGIIFIPFSDFWDLLPLGELQHEVSAYIFLGTMALMVTTYLKAWKSDFSGYGGVKAYDMKAAKASSSLLLKMMVLMLAIVAISFLMNFPDMVKDNYRGRLPMGKFLTSTMVMVYGFGLAYMAQTLGKKYDWTELITKPVAISIGICSAAAAIEVLSWYSGGAQTLWQLMSQVLHVAYRFDDELGTAMADTVITGRARGVCFEPPALANFAGLAWPWAYAAFHSSPKKHKALYGFVWFLCTMLVLVANSRTSIVLLIGDIFVLALLKIIYLPSRPQSPVMRRAVSLLLIILTISGIAAVILNNDAIVANIIAGDSTSNITRYSSMTAAFRMFEDRPVWGWGFGQYGFHVVDYMPSWGYYSWEIRAWFLGNFFAVVWPPVFSIYARFAAELGILGLVMWTGIWTVLAHTIWRVTLAFQYATGKVLLMSYPLIISCYAALLSGIALDSLRSPMMWISMGLGCAYIYDVRSRLLEITCSKVPVAPIKGARA